MKLSEYIDQLRSDPIRDIPECIKGMRVYYIPFEGCDKSSIEYGVITSINDRHVFIKFDKDINSKACNINHIWIL